jgi:molybdate transport system permease protein
VRARLFELTLAVAAGVSLAFLLLPLLALFLRVSPARLISALGSPAARDALVVSLETSAVAHVFILAFGTPAAYLLARRRFRGRSLVLAAIDLPLVLPPAVAGIALLAAFGRRGLLGGTFSALGVEIPFTKAAVVLAVIFVASPFYLRQAVAAFSTIDQDLFAAARTLGAGPLRSFARVALPLALPGLGVGSSLAFARGLGEFGATIMFAGSVQGVTQTLPLAIYAQLDTDFEAALAIGALLVLVSVAVLLTVRLLPSWTRFESTSPIAFAPSRSS